LCERGKRRISQTQEEKKAERGGLKPKAAKMKALHQRRAQEQWILVDLP